MEPPFIFSLIDLFHLPDHHGAPQNSPRGVYSLSIMNDSKQTLLSKAKRPMTVPFFLEKAMVINANFAEAKVEFNEA